MSFPKLEALASPSRLTGILASFALVAAGAVAPSAYGQNFNDCGDCDVFEDEVCLDDDADRANDGCNVVPIDFDEGACDITICGTTSTWDHLAACVEDADCIEGEFCVDGMCLQDTRDTDWFLVSQATLALADLDGNGVVLIRSTVTSEAAQATFIITQAGPELCDGIAIPSVGYSDPGCLTGDSAELVVILADHPLGVIVWTGPSPPDGSGTFDGVECGLGANDYTLHIECIELFEACAPDAGGCSVANGTPGCEDPACCDLVCGIDDNCCLGPDGWDQVCVDLALGLNCAAITCDPEGTTIGDNIGGSPGNIGPGFATQLFPDFPDFNIIAIDDVTVSGGSITATCLDMSAQGFNGFEDEDWNNVDFWRVEVYSSPEAAGSNLTGDVYSALVPAPLVEPFGDQDMLRIDLTGAPGPALVLAPGTYWIGVTPSMDFGLFGQISVGVSSIGNNNAWQANPAGGFDFGETGLSDLGVNLAYRLVGDPVVGGGDVHANAFTAFRGFLDSGTLADTLTSDDVDLCHDLGITIFPSEAPITLYFDGTLPNDSPASLSVTFESSANTPGLELTIAFWNYNTASWQNVGTASQGFNVDAVRVFNGTPADHVESGTGNVRTRYEVRQTGIIFQFPWTDCIDEMFWTHN